jgi:hypothetical protein
MRLASALLLVAFLALTAPTASAQPADSVQAWFNPSIAFTWPQPFNHVPQTFEAQAVRFTNPGGRALSAVDVYAHSSSASPDGFNDTLVVSVHAPDANGYPGAVRAERRFELAELEPGRFTDLPLGISSADAAGDFWVSFELRAAGGTDQLVLVSGGAQDPSLDRAAVRIEGEGWRLLRESQFTREYNYHVRAHFATATSAHTGRPADALRIAQAWPLPAADRLHVRVEGADAGGTLDLHDVLGRRVLGQPLGRSATLDLTSLPAGLYVLRAVSDGAVATRTVVVR